MARPSRKGWTSPSRRERDRVFYAWIATAVAILAALALLVTSRSDPGQGRRLRGALLDVTAPAWGWARTPVAAVESWAGAVGDYFGVVERNRALEAALERDRRLMEQRDAYARQNAQLKRLLGVVDASAGWSRTVAIAGGSSGSDVRSAIVAGGRAQGLRPGQPVRGVDGLVGRIVEVGDSAARVLLLTDAASRVPVRVVRNGRPAMAAGTNGALIEIRYAAPVDGQLRVGDRLVTSGDGGVFPPDLPVAVVSGFDGETPLARPVARLDGLGYVIVQSPWLPPPPAGGAGQLDTPPVEPAK